MKLTPLSNPEERGKDHYVETSDGRVIDLMPKLIKAGYRPVGVATIIRARLNPNISRRFNSNTCSDWDGYFFTGDSSATDNTGAALFTLDSPILRKLTLEDEKFLVVGGLDLALKTDAKRARMLWNELKADKEHSLYLTPAQVQENHGKGYVRKRGVFVPATKTVEKVWDFLSQGQNMKEYAQQVSEDFAKEWKYDKVMRVCFDASTKPQRPQFRSLVLNSMSAGDSNVLGYDRLDCLDSRLAGVSNSTTAGVKVARSGHRSKREVSSLMSGVENSYSLKVAAEDLVQSLEALGQRTPSEEEVDKIIAKLDYIIANSRR